MTNPNDVQNYLGATAEDTNGEKIGKIGQVYLDDETQQPTWITVHTGLFGGKETFAPLYGSRWNGDKLTLAVSHSLVRDAPNTNADGHLDDTENDRLYTYYHDYLGAGSANTARADVSGERSAQGHDTSGPNTDDAMTLSEERLRVGTQQVESGRARLRKYVVTENVTTTVPLRHEKVRLEREPITDANIGAAMSGGDFTEEEHEVVLHAERPVVQTEAVPVERVRLATETVTEDQVVTGQVRKEKIDEPDIDIDRR